MYYGKDNVLDRRDLEVPLIARNKLISQPFQLNLNVVRLIRKRVNLGHNSTV